MGSKRQDICTKVNAAFEGILISNEYRTNLGRHVFEWRATALEESELDGIVWKDRGNAYEGPVTGRTSNNLTFELMIYCAGSGEVTAPERMRDCIADIRKCLMNNNTWGNLAIGTSLIEDETSEIEQAGRKIAGILIKFSIKYITSTADF